MTWVFTVTLGSIAHNGMHVGNVYSGNGPDLDNPADEAVVGHGPIPRGEWQIGTFFDHPHLGPCVARLTPVGHDAHGRSGFFIHGDNAAMNHTASDGCIIAAQPIRHAICLSHDTKLIVS